MASLAASCALWCVGGCSLFADPSGPTSVPPQVRPVPAQADAPALDVVEVPPGQFLMGCTPGRDGDCGGDEQPAFEVRIGHGLVVMRGEVSQRDYVAMVGTNPSRLPGCEACPVEQVTATEAAAWCNLRSVADGLPLAYDLRGARPVVDTQSAGWRLPTEAEWEYLARGDEAWPYAGSMDLRAVAWTAANSSGRHHPSGELAPNGFGLVDMSGNVWELTGNSQWSYAEVAPAGPPDPTAPVVDPPGLTGGDTVVVRGGAWADFDSAARVSYRGFPPADHRDVLVGFRAVRTVVADAR